MAVEVERLVSLERQVGKLIRGQEVDGILNLLYEISSAHLFTAAGLFGI